MREEIIDKMKSDNTDNVKEMHQAALAKQKHMEKLRDALKISKDHEFGVAFDYEAQE